MSVGTSGYRPFYSHTSFMAAEAVCPPSPNQPGRSQQEAEQGPGRCLWTPLNFHNPGQQHVTADELSSGVIKNPHLPHSPLRGKISFQANIYLIASNTLWHTGQKCSGRHTQAQGSTWCSEPLRGEDADGALLSPASAIHAQRLLAAALKLMSVCKPSSG